ncbi:MAG: hypothetical protein OXC83_00615 [Chloroflexi bacterium]|nr:hypothetical protein [Chloroflexota bacterium]
MSDREKDTPEKSEDEPEELSLGELGAVFGGWHPAPPPPDPPSDSIPRGDA